MLGNHCIARGAVIFVKNNTEAQEISEPLCFRLLLAKPDSYFLPLTSYLSPLTCQNGPRPMQLVVVMAVRFRVP